jgi:hypothetical protein
VTKAKLEGAFSDELERLQPTPGYMRLVKDLVLRAWRAREVEVGRDAADAERSAKAIQQKLDRLDEAFIYAKAIDLDTYERQRDRLRQELTLTQIDRTPVELDKFDLEGILTFAERVLPRASDLWVQASLNQKQRLQQLFFPDGIAFDGKRFVRTAVTTNAFNYLTCADGSENGVASPTGFEPITRARPPSAQTDLLRHERHETSRIVEQDCMKHLVLHASLAQLRTEHGLRPPVQRTFECARAGEIG